jgi:death-on-curing protein
MSPVVTGEPVWILRQALLLKHAESLRLFGGAEGIRDEGALDSALMRPVNAWSYGGETRLAALAAGYAFGLAKNHPFIDGNKRAAFIAYVTFLKANGFDLRAPQPEAYRTMLALAAGDMSEAAFAGWLETHLAPRTP